MEPYQTNPSAMQPAQNRVPVGDRADSELLDQISSLTRRIRLLEDRYSNVQKKMQVTEQNLLQSNRKENTEIKAITSEITDLKRVISQLKSDMNQIIKELQECAKREDVAVIKKYLELWQPVNFVTQNEVERIVEELLAEKLEKTD